RGELGEAVGDRGGAALNEPVGTEEQRVPAPQLEEELLVLAVRLHAEQHALGHRLDRCGLPANQDWRQMPGPGPAEHPGPRAVPAADHGPRDTLTEYAGPVVQL